MPHQRPNHGCTFRHGQEGFEVRVGGAELEWRTGGVAGVGRLGFGAGIGMGRGWWSGLNGFGVSSGSEGPELRLYGSRDPKIRVSR